MSIEIDDVMNDIGTQLATVAGLRVFAFPPLSAQPPFAYVNLPEQVDYDLTYGRGQDRMTLEVHVGVANQVDRTCRDAIIAYASGGPTGLKAVIEASTVFDYRVTTATFATVVLSSGTYAGLVLTVDVAH